jgi:catechol 2,3-dioxygenase-like lactoylglutathione lyase family enzyme
MKVVFVAGYGPITTDTKKSAAFYRESLGLSFKEEADGYFHTEELEGVKHFALWPVLATCPICPLKSADEGSSQRRGAGTW